MIKADPLTTTCFKKLPQSSVLTILLSFGIWNELESWKVSISRCLVSWPQIKKVVLLECRLLLFCATTTNHFSIRLWHAGEGNGTPLQYSCLENPVDRGAWWAAVHGVTQKKKIIKKKKKKDCDMQQKVDFIWQPVTSNSGVALRRSTKALPKAKPAPKKRSWSLFGGLLPAWSTTAF